jgi:hypothetical protein
MQTAGTIKVGGRVAYVAQTAWIMNDTVQVGEELVTGLLCVRTRTWYWLVDVVA